MNNRRSIVVFTAIALLAMTSLSPQVSSQKADQRSSAQSLQQGEFMLVDSNSNQNLPTGSRLACGKSSGSGFYYEGPGVTLRFSFGQSLDQRFATQPVVGSWMVRNIVAAGGGRAESVAAYLFDGKFDRGTINLSTAGKPDSYDLVATTTLSFCAPSGHPDGIRRFVRIRGTCGTNQEIRFQVTNQPQTDYDLLNAPPFYASATFRGDVTCQVASDGSRVRANLDRR